MIPALLAAFAGTLIGTVLAAFLHARRMERLRAQLVARLTGEIRARVSEEISAALPRGYRAIDQTATRP